MRTKKTEVAPKPNAPMIAVLHSLTLSSRTSQIALKWLHEPIYWRIKYKIQMYYTHL